MDSPRMRIERPRRVMARLLLCLVVAALASCEGRPRPAEPLSDAAAPGEPHLAVIDLRSGLPELTFSSLFAAPRPTSFSHLILELRELAEDDDVEGLFVRLGVAELGFARADEVGRRLKALREAGRPIVCHADGYGNGTMLLAARGCDELWVSPAGTVETVGVAAQLLFGRALLDRLEVQVDYLQIGEYKGAEEAFTRESASPEARSSLQRALGALREAWMAGIAEGRGAASSALELERGPHTSERAKELGLVDRVGFEREAHDRALERAGVDGALTRFGGDAQRGASLSDLLRLFGGGGGPTTPHVALVRLTGAITLARSGGILRGPGGIAERQLSRKLRELEEDESVVAVVLRIDSPGGSALASDVIWHGLMKLREAKPLVISVGGMAASGGYYLACAGTKVVVERTSIIGSIGVVGGKLSVGKSLEKIGVHVESIPAVEGGSTRALYGSALSAWDEATREKVRASMEDAYALFVQRIATGRGMDRSAVEPHAAGRLMGGQQSVDAGLADETGGLDRAITLALELAGAEADTLVQIVDADGGLVDLLGGIDTPNATLLARLEERAALEAQRRASDTLLDALDPLRSQIEAFTSSLQPLLAGEHTLAALPFVLIVR